MGKLLETNYNIVKVRVSDEGVLNITPRDILNNPENIYVLVLRYADEDDIFYVWQPLLQVKIDDEGNHLAWFIGTEEMVIYYSTDLDAPFIAD